MKIKELRLSLKLSQERFAAKLGVSTFTVRRWEHQIHLPNFANQREIKRVFGVDL
ncbi:hypothetical protein LCGC14_0365870 [marine sediment metagenome]|uniref:HTH cro/C1-type domain-containing protein n=1 Tax=marine sediment metagenome TaxID=412755 RepID=A0A0F9T6U5_9ZZZZ